MKSRKLSFNLLLVLSLALACCNGGADTAMMRKLASIDSTLSVARQYELAQQRLDSLHPLDMGKAERAYYSLLLTQSRYKNYIDDTTDAVINVAVDYYEHHGDAEKRARSLIYQGCVREIMGHPEKAIESFKKAEGVAKDDDLENKAYAKLRLATLYADNTNYADLKIRKYKEALDLYNQLGDKHYQIVCLTDLGGYYRNRAANLDSARYYIDKAIRLSQQQHETWFLFQNLYLRAEMYCLLTKEFDKAKVDILQALQAGKDEIDHPRAHYVAAETYLNLGRPDSALYYLQHAPPSGVASNHMTDTVMYCRLMSEIAKANKDWDNYTRYYERANSMADSILIGNVNKNYLAVEKKYDIQLAELNKVKYQSRWRGALLVVALLALAALALTFMMWRYRSRLRTIENEAEVLRADLDGSLKGLQQMQVSIDGYEQQLQRAQEQMHNNQSQLDALRDKLRHSDEMRAIVDGQIRIVHQLMEQSYQYDSNTFARKFNELMTLPEAGGDSESYWNNLQMLVNDLYDNVLVEAQHKAGGTLREDEINFLALYSCGFSRTVIMICMKYRNLGTVSNKKLQIARKLGVHNLDEFVARYHQPPQPAPHTQR